MSKKSLDQERAAYAWKRVVSKDSSCRDKYKSLAKNFPALIMSNGLMQSMAFLERKNGVEHRALLSDVISWFEVKGLISQDDARQGFDGVMAALSECDSLKYRRATEEAIEILKWIRQMADAAIKGD